MTTTTKGPSPTTPKPPTTPSDNPQQQQQQQQQQHGSTPSDFLHAVVGRPVTVKLNSSVEYRGVLACLDGYMNIALEQTQEYENGQVKHVYGDAFIRGNNVLYIATSFPKSKQQQQ